MKSSIDLPEVLCGLSEPGGSGYMAAPVGGGKFPSHQILLPSSTVSSTARQAMA